MFQEAILVASSKWTEPVCEERPKEAVFLLKGMVRTTSSMDRSPRSVGLVPTTIWTCRPDSVG